MTSGRKILWLTVARDAALALALSSVLALTANALRSTGGIPLVADREYEILVPCPEYEGQADPLEPDQLRPGAEGLLLVDAREAAEFSRWHLPGAISIPFDYLEPTSEANVRKVLDTRARQVVVYGDGQQPDSGQELARELGGKGLRNIKYVKGGAPALRKAAGR